MLPSDIGLLVCDHCHEFCRGRCEDEPSRSPYVVRAFGAPKMFSRFSDALAQYRAERALFGAGAENYAGDCVRIYSLNYEDVDGEGLLFDQRRAVAAVDAEAGRL